MSPKQEIGQRVHRIAASMRGGSDLAGEAVIAGEPAAVAGAAGIVDIELVLAQIHAELHQVIAPDLGGGEARLKVVVDLAAQRVAVEPLRESSR